MNSQTKSNMQLHTNNKHNKTKLCLFLSHTKTNCFFSLCLFVFKSLCPPFLDLTKPTSPDWEAKWFDRDEPLVRGLRTSGQDWPTRTLKTLIGSSGSSTLLLVQSLLVLESYSTMFSSPSLLHPSPSPLLHRLPLTILALVRVFFSIL